MSTTKHTPGKWILTPNNTESGDISPFHYIDAPGGQVLAVKAASLSEANAARIVACVNACEGINPEAVPEMLEALRWIRDNCTGLPAVARALAARAITKAEGK